MRILITGSNGLVGKNVLEHPALKEFTILTPSSKEVNLIDYRVLDKYLQDQKPDMIIHAAGRVGGIQANIMSPVKYFLDNIDIGRNIVWAAYENGVKQLLNLGSSCIYPRNACNPLTEDMILTGELEPTNEGYALAKIATLRLCEYISRENPEFQYKTLLPCNLYGRWDKFDPMHSHLIPAVIHKIHSAKVNGDKYVEIWGDGKAFREFMYAGDIADCIMHSVKKFDELPMLMNVGIGSDYTINEYYEAIKEIVGYTGEFIHDLSKPVGMQRKLVSVSRQTSWGWGPKISIQEGLRKTYDFYLNHNIETVSMRV